MTGQGWRELQALQVRRKVSRWERAGYALLLFAFVVGLLFVCMLTNEGRP